MARLCRNLQYFALRICGNSWFLYRLLRRLEVFEELIVNADSQICIDGFPRSANTFLTLFLAHWNPDVKAAHHVHLPLQIRMAAKYQVPTIVVIRHPLDAVMSLMTREKFLYPWLAILSYTLFYRKIDRYRASFIVADFSTCISEPDKIVELVNMKFKKSFKNGKLTEELQGQLFSRIDQVNQLHSGDETTTSRPSKLRNSGKQEMAAIISRNRFYPGALTTYCNFQELL